MSARAHDLTTFASLSVEKITPTEALRHDSRATRLDGWVVEVVRALALRAGIPRFTRARGPQRVPIPWRNRLRSFSSVTEAEVSAFDRRSALWRQRCRPRDSAKERANRANEHSAALRARTRWCP